MSSQWMDRRRFRGGTKPSPSIAFLFLVSIVLLMMMGPCCGSAIRGSTASAEEGNANANANADRLRGLANDEVAMLSCRDATVEFVQQNDAVAEALESYEGTEIQSMDEGTGVEFIGYPLEATNDMGDVCVQQNGHWAYAASLNYTCSKTMGTDRTTPLHVENFGICFPPIDDCLETDAISLIELAPHLGWDCLYDEADSDSDGDLDKDKGEGEGENSGKSDQEPTDADASEESGSDVLAPGDEADSSDTTLPFLTDGDVLCLDSTTEFINQNKGLASAIDTFKGSQILTKDEETGVELFGYPEDTTNVMKSACELKKGHWAFVKSMSLTCVIEAMETIPLHVHNFGRCLTKTDDCLEMDTTSLLRADLAGLGFNCWEDDDDEESSGDGGVDGDNGADTKSGQGSESGGNAEENGDASETDPETDSTEGETNNDQDSDMDTDGQDPSDDIDSELADLFAGMGLSESDTICMVDSAKFVADHPELEEAIEGFDGSMEIDAINEAFMTIGFSSTAADKLRSVCTDSTIGGYFSIIEKVEFDCSMMGVDLGLSMTNIANCMADTDECRNFNALQLMEDMWNSMEMTCIEKLDADEDNGKGATSSTTDTSSEPDGSGGGNDNDKPDGEDESLAKALGLTESEVACMSGLASFVESSEELSGATATYQKSVQMNDPTKLGYTAASASEMEQVCKDQGGIWSFIESEDVTCIINGQDRCINVYNFGNCITNNDDCQSMDPFVLVKGFFMEVLDFSCREKCDEHKDATAGQHSPSSAPHQNNNNNNGNLSSQQKNGSSSSSPNELPQSFTTAAIVLVVVVALGFFGFYRYRASSGRERNVRSTYEMTDITDLGFESFT